MVPSRGRAALAAVVLGLCLWLSLVPRAAWAEDPSFLAVGAGVYDVLHDFKAAQGRLEFRFANRFLLVKPMVGMLVTSKGSVMGYGGNGKNLGSALEFKTGAEFAYRFQDHSRLGLQFDHISNAGITKRNPGTESLVLFWSFPIGAMKR